MTLHDIQCTKPKCGHKFRTENGYGDICPKCDEYVETPAIGYLRDLADRIFKIPVMYGTDQSDYDRLRTIATRLESKAHEKPCDCPVCVLDEIHNIIETEAENDNTKLLMIQKEIKKFRT